MNETPPVSGMCLTYGRPNLLEEAIESFLRQDYRGKKELLVLNDLADQMLAFDHPEVRIVNVNMRFRTIGEKRNACAALCTHDWLFVWDDDDIYLPWRISYSMKMMDAKCGFFKTTQSLSLSNGRLSGPDKNMFHASACFHRRVLDEIRGYAHMGSGEDQDFESRVSQVLAGATLAQDAPPEKLYYIYRWAGTGSYHLSAFGTDKAGEQTGTEKVTRHVASQIQSGSMKRGKILLEPSWQVNYAAGVARYLKDPVGASELPLPRARSSPDAKKPSALTQMARKAVASLRTVERRRAVARWLAHCADPEGPRTGAPRRALSPQEALDLVSEADAHGVLPAVLRHFPPFAAGDAAFEAARSDALARQRLAQTFSMMLRHQGDALLAAANGLPVALVKGQTFARTLYPAPQLRPFTDIDLLVAPEAKEKLEQILTEQEFSLAAESHIAGRREWKWVHRTNSALMAEVHTNMVHAPSLQRTMSLSYADIAEFGIDSPASLLIVAIIHGALHQFERLRQVVDICQAARALRTAEEERQFRVLAERSGALLAAATGLGLAYRIFGEPRAREIARALGPVPHRRLAALLMGRSAVMSTMNGARVYHSWRRQGLRELLKRGTLPDTARPVERPI